jgi:hypothetical protein
MSQTAGLLTALARVAEAGRAPWGVQQKAGVTTRSPLFLKIWGSLLLSLGWIAYLVGIGAIAAFMSIMRDYGLRGGLIPGIVAFLTAAVFMRLGSSVGNRGKRALALRDQIVFAKTKAPRSPGQNAVLYLRSFAADEILAVPREPFHLSDTMLSEEKQLVNVLSEIGPVYAVGMPGEQLPPIGAYRDKLPWYVSWKRHVKKEISRAALVVIAAGDSPGLRWEIKTAVKLTEPKRLLLIIPFGPAEYERFRKAAPAFPRPLPDYPGEKRVNNLFMCGAVYFTNQWEPHFVRFDSRKVKDPLFSTDAASLGLLEMISVVALSPVFQSLGVEPPIAKKTLIFSQTSKRQRKIAVSRLRVAWLMIGGILLLTLLMLLYMWFIDS